MPSRWPASPSNQLGVFLPTTALALLFLLGFMGLALDFGRLFVAKTELQTAMDSCALAAARELNGQPLALERARQAGRVAGNLNRVHFQSQAAALEDGDIVFSDTLTGPYSAAPVGTARYVRCQRSLGGLAPLLLQAMDAFASTDVGGVQSVAASAVATLMPAQTDCLMPIGVCSKPGGFTRGEWISGITNSNDDMDVSGQFRWLDFLTEGGTDGAREIKDLLAGPGQCGLPGTDTRVTKSGKTNGAVDAWNTRFGLYKGSYSAGTHLPDTTGYAWYVSGNSVPAQMLGRYGDPAAGYGFHKARNSPYQGDNQSDNRGLHAQSGNRTPTSAEVHRAGNEDSRVISVAVINCDGAPIAIQGYACMFMLHPMAKAANGKTSKMWLEYIADATATTGNPCVTAGLPGSGGGQRVPGLVQ